MFKNAKTNIVFCGFMGTGKTILAKNLARELNLSFVDLDKVIEEREGCTISEIFTRKGETYFRELEKVTVAEFSNKNHLVISTGGGVVLDPENIVNLGKNGILINLQATPETILKRTSQTSHRPLLKTQDQLKSIKELLDKRAPAYLKCDIQVITDNKSVRDLTQEIKKLVFSG